MRLRRRNSFLHRKIHESGWGMQTIHEIDEASSHFL
jgi:hypothetical protein